MGPPRGWCILWFTTLLCMATLPRTASQGSCVRAGFTACCDPSGPINCSISSGNSSCYCDQECYSLNDCCFDIQDVPCFPVDRPLTLLNVIGDPVNNTDVITECTAQFSPGVPLEAVRIRWYSGDGNEIISNLPRVQVGSVEQLNVSHFIRRISLTPVILEDSDNYTCVAYAEGDLLFSSNSSATAEFIVELPAIIVVPPTNTIANISATFTCEVAGVPLPTISWTLPNGNQITSQAMRSNDSSQTFALTEISNESPIIAVSMLNIESVSPGDEGEYTCTAVNTRNSVSETATLTVQVDRPLILLNVVGDPVNNTNVIAECTAQFCPGVPLEAVRIQWYNGDGNEIISNLPRLQVGSVEQLNETHFIRQISLTPVILEDSDNYTCIAYTEGELLFSSNSSAIAEFIVELPAVIVESPMNVIINVTNNATFICEVAGVPLPSISWTLPNGNQIISQVMSSGNDSSQTFALTELSTESPIAAVSVLYIESVSPGDEGEYTCTAINAKNTVSETAILTVQVPPVVLAENRSLLGLERESIAIRFSINSDSPPVQTSDIRWYFIPDEASDDSDFTDITEQRLIGETLLMFSESHLGLTLSGLTQDAAGVYMLVATNPAGMAFDYTNLTIQAVPRFTAISEDQFVTLTAEQPQAPVTFSCSVYAIPRTNTTWTYVTANGEATITGSEAISIEQTINGYVTNSTLSFTVGVEDRGAFVCSAENVHGEIEDSISLVVYVVPDTLTLNGTNGDIPEGAEIQLQCSISEGWPRPTLMWMRNDVELLNSSRLQIENSTYQTDNGLYRATSVLTISSSFPSDTGVYYCSAEVAIPEVALPPVSINITVTMAAPSTIEISPQSITVNETDTATFTCSVVGVPLPSITWALPNGTNLESLAFNQQDVADEQTGVYAETIISNETPYAATSMLNIAPVSRGDAGEYICTAINRLANASSTAILTVQVPPVVLAEDRILLGLEQETLIIRFSIVDAAPPVQPSDISWYFIPDGANASNAIDITEQTAIGGTALTFSNSRLELTISSITQEATGIYRLVATTPAGTGSNSTDLEMVQAAPRFAFPPEDQSIILTTDQPQDTVRFSCSAYAIPIINITWTYITFDGEAMILSNSLERINIEQEREGYITSSVLMLSDATFTDRGVFMCDAGNIHGDIFANASLTVYVVPDMLILNGTAGEIIERAEIQLQCSLSEGWPRPMLVWLRDDVELSNSSRLQIDDDISMTAAGLYVASSILYIPSSLPGDSGTYTCRPDIDIPDTTISPMSVFINVIMREPATITEAPQSITINETDSTTFTCSVTGVPLPSITWTLPDRRNITALDQQSEEPPRIYAQSITSEETPYATMSTLFIDSASRSDEGAYTCTAMNDDSIASSSATLTVQVPPVVLADNPALLDLEQESITIRFSINDASPLVQLSNIRWFFIAGVDVPEIDITEEEMLGETALTFSESLLELSLSGLTQDAAGIYRLVATNPAGIASDDTNLTIQAAPRFVQRPEDQQIILSTASPLGSLTLICNVYAIPEATITWMHIPSNGEATVLTDSLERIDIEQNQEGYTTFSTLTFANVTFTDRGEFRCTAENEHSIINSTASLVVYVVPELTLTGTAGDIIEETEIQLQCSLSDAWPMPELMLFKDDTPLVNSTSRLQIGSNIFMTEAGLYTVSKSLTINSSIPEDSGQYSCRADIQVPDTAIPSRSVFITVTRRAPATIVLPPQSITVNATNQATFTCGVAGVPLPSIIWTLPDGSNPESLERQSDELPRIYTETSISDETPYAASSILYIDSVSRVDEGDFTCTAINDQATIENTAFLTVQVPPIVLAENRMLLGLEEENVNIQFSIINDSPQVQTSDIQWFFLEDRDNASEFLDITDDNTIGSTVLSFSDSLLTLKLSGLTQEAAGIYRLVATNPAGIDSNYTSLTIEATPRFVTLPQNQFVVLTPGRPQGSIMLSCIVYAIPLANITWMYTQDNSEKITLENSIQRFEIDESTEGYTTTLTVIFAEIVFGDSGNFECRAENMHAVSTSIASLTVYDVPDALTVDGSAGEITEGDRIEIQCKVPAVFPRPTLVWLRDTTVLFSSTRIQLVTVVNQTQGRFVASSSLTIPNSIPDDSGRYICRADVTVPGTTIPPVDITITVTARNECASNPCANGVCIDRVDSYFCMCNGGFIGTNCDEPATVPSAPVIRQPPVNTTVRLGEIVNLTCISEGIPAPTYTWFRDGVELQDETLPYLLLTSASPNDRGYYICTVSNSEGTASSLPALLSIQGVRQYAANFEIDNRVKRQSGNENLDRLVDQLRGRSIGDTGVTIYDATVQSYNPDTNEASLLMTLSSGTDSGSFPTGLGGSLGNELVEAGQTISIEIQPTIARFDGCPDEEAAGYNWPETDLGMVAMVSCICGNIDTAEISRVAIRECGGSFAEGAAWVEPDISTCQFSGASMLLCDASTLNETEAITQVSVITAVTTELNSVDISIAVEIITRPDVIIVAATNPDIQDAFLDSIDQVLQGGDEDVLQSQQDSGASTDLLEGVETFTEAVVLLVGETERTFPEETFVLHVQETSVDDYTGLTFGLDIDINIQAGFDDDSVSSSSGIEVLTTTSLIVPDTILEDAGISSGQNARLAYNVFADATLFQPRPEFQNSSGLESFAVGSAIQSLVIAGSGNTRLQLSNPIRMRFQKTREAMENGTNPMCVFWDPALDDGFGGFSTDGCRMVSDEPEFIECECDHLTSFCILLDVAPRPQANLGVEVITYIGLGVSIISLIITIITYLFTRKLRSTVNGQLLVNLSLALLGLFVVFIISAQGQNGLTTAGCGFFAAALHYFLLAYFFFTAAEALFLYYKLVKVFMGQSFFIRNYIYIAMLVAWVTPLIIVAISLAGYQYYGSSTGGDDSDNEVNFCRPYEWPFYFGFIAPFVAIYIFNWIMFIVIIFSLCRHAAKSETADTKSIVMRQLCIAMILSLLFGLGWAFGLIGSSSLPSGVSITGQYIFSIFIGFQGVLIFFLHAVRSTDAREEWKCWWYWITCRTEQYRIYRTTSKVSGSRSKTGTLPTRATSHSTSPSDSFHMASFSEATRAKDDTLKKPLTSEDEKMPRDVPLQETTLALNLIVENPLAKVKEEEARMEEEESSTGSPNPTDAVAITLSIEAGEEDTTTKL